MCAMSLSAPNSSRETQSLAWAILISLAIHGVVLFFPRLSPPIEDRLPRRMQATLAPPSSVPLATAPPAAATPKSAPARPRSRSRVLALDKSQARLADAASPRWSVAERQEMDSFLRELEQDARARPDLAQRSLAMARAIGREREIPDEDGSELLERRPDGPPVDPLSLEFYLDSLVKKLNRSAGFVRNDPRVRGMRTAALLIRIDPDGSLQSFKVLNAGDQQGEIAFTQSVVERAAPFAAFPPDIRKSAKSLALIVCILPANAGGDGFGFSRSRGGRKC
jgi:hypothetical protein